METVINAFLGEPRLAGKSKRARSSIPLVNFRILVIGSYGCSSAMSARSWFITRSGWMRWAVP
jgi:hypothetical protein